MKFKLNLKILSLIVLSLISTSCLPSISVRAGNGDEAEIFFSTGFSEATAKTLRGMAGLNQDDALFSKDDILLLLQSAGAVKTSASLPSSTEIAANGTIPALSQNQLYRAGVLKKDSKSLVLTLGPRQIVEFYNLLSEDSKSYLDLMMIPALIGEKMTADEYKELLSSMYGPTFADEIVNGKLTVVLTSPDGKKSQKETISLGELLTSLEEKSWVLKF